MRWNVMADRIPFAPLSLLEAVVSRIRRARAPRPARPASAGGPYRDSPAPSAPSAGEVSPTFGVEWARYRRLRRTVLVLGAGLLPGILVLAPRLAQLTGTDSARELFVLGWGFCLAVSGIRWSLFSCPRCRQCFRDPRGWGPWPHERCHSCGLPIFALFDPDAAPAQLPDDEPPPSRAFSAQCSPAKVL